jgi:hypothetical protein
MGTSPLNSGRNALLLGPNSRVFSPIRTASQRNQANASTLRLGVLKEVPKTNDPTGSSHYLGLKRV